MIILTINHNNYFTMNPNNRNPKRPINHYEEVKEVECLHDIPITHIRRRGKWIPYVSILFYIIILLTFYFRVVLLRTPLI